MLPRLFILASSKSKRILRSFLLNTLILIIIKTGFSQDLSYLHYSDEDGLPSMTIYGIKQDLKAYLWISTTKGICRFDGREFKKYTSSEMKGQDIPFLFMDENGIPWFYNLAGEIFNITNDHINKIKISSPNPSMSISNFFVNEEQIYITWAGNNIYRSFEYNKSDPDYFCELPNAFGFIGCLNNNLLATAVKDDRNKSFKLYSVKDNRLLYTYTLQPNPFKKPYYFNYHNEFNLISYISQDSIYLFSPYFAGLFNSKFELKHAVILKELVKDTVLYISLINKSELFIKSNFNSFIFNLRKGTLDTLPPWSVFINTITEDDQKRYWISTTNKGLFLKINNNLQIYTTDNSNIHSNEITCMVYEYPMLMIGHGNSSISVFNQQSNNWNILTVPGSRRIKAIQKLSSNQFILGTDNGIYHVYLTSNKKILKSYLINGSIKDIFITNNNTLYFSTGLGTYSCKLNELLTESNFQSKINTEINIRSNSITMYRDTILVATVKGIYYKDKIGLKKWDNFPSRNFYINKLISGQNNRLWICTDGDGVYKIHDGKIIDSLNSSNGLPSNSISYLAEIDEHQIIVGTDNGAYIYNTLSKNGFGFNKLDGLPSKEIVSICHSHGNLWFGTNKGLVSIPLKQLQPNFEKPLIEIININTISKDGEYPFKAQLPYNQNHIRVHLQTRSLLSKEQLRINYKLYKSDSSWISTSNKILEFIGLAPGKYELQIKAINEDGVESEKPLVLPFVINPPWWKTFWFSLSALVTILLGSISISYLVFYNNKKKENTKRNILEQFNQLRLQALQNQMNPHFIFNALNAIQSYLGTSDEKNAMNYLSKFGKLIRIIFEQSKRKTITLEEEIELLTNYIQLEELRFRKKLKVNFYVDPLLILYGPDINIPPLLVQPIVENSFRHGLLHMGKDGILSIQIILNGNQVECIVEDNGIGRVKSKIINEWKKKNHISSGISSTVERLIILDNDQNNIGLDIIDLYDKNNRPAGTRATIVLQILNPKHFKI